MLGGDRMIQLGGMKISLDMKEDGANIDFISHAHSDHISAAKSSSAVFASEQTSELLECAYGIKINPIRPSENVGMLEAGHMLGSRQLCVDDPSSGKRIVYTGDFQMQRSKTSEPIKVVNADCVILDSTYYEPSYAFGPKEASESRILKWAEKTLEKGIVLFSAYRMGKGQELISIFNQSNIVPVVSRRISEVNKVYEKNNIQLRYLSANESAYDNECSEVMSGNFVGITESRQLQRLAAMLSRIHGRDVYTAMATGFASVMDFSTDMQFSLSDHADFPQSIEYIQASGASNIYSYGPNAIEFAKNLGRLGYDAAPLPKDQCFGRSVL